MLELYTHAVSPASQKVRLALAEKGLDWERHDVDLPNKENLEPWYLALNPQGVLPTLVHDGQPVVESSIICEYLEDIFPAPALRPTDAGALARMRLWMKLVDERLHTAAGAFVWALFMGPVLREKPEDERERLLSRIPDRARQDRHRRWVDLGADSPDFQNAVFTYRETFDAMNRALAEQEWMTGDNFGLADCALLPYLHAMRQLGWDGMYESEHPLVADWFARARMRPSYRTTIEDEIPAAVMGQMQKVGATVKDRVLARFAASA